MSNTKGKVFVAMALFGTTGFFLRYVQMPIATAALICCLLGIVAVLGLMKLTKRKLRWRHIKEYLPMTVLSGVALGGSWLLLFGAQKSSDSTVSTVYYYLAPMALALLTPLLGEKYRKKKLWVCALCLGALVLATGFWKKGFVWDFRFLLALGAGALYCGVIVINKRLEDISSYDKTVIQLATVAVMLLPYCLFTGGFAITGIGGAEFVALAILGVAHAGLGCRMYFDGVVRLPLQSIAIYNFINPAVTIFATAFVSKENLNAEAVLGVVLILGGIMISELSKENFGRLFQKKG